MAAPKGLETTETAASMLGISYSKFMRLHSKEIPSEQLHQRGPRLYRTEDVQDYIEQLSPESEVE